jgi:integrase/recombinase XerD
MRREFIQELRGYSRRGAIDIYDHIDLKELKNAYLEHIPQMGIEEMTGNRKQIANRKH